MDLEQGFLTGIITQRIQGVCKLELERIYIFIFINYDLAWLSECKQQTIVSIVITLTFYQYKSQILLYHTITISYITKYYLFSSHRITLLIVIGLYISLFLNVLILKCVYSVQFSSVAQLCPTLCNPVNRSTPGLPVHYQLPEFTQTHVHRVGDAIQPSHPLSSSSPPAPNPSQHQGPFQWVNSSHEVAKVLEFQLQHQSFQWTPRTNLL